MTTRARAGDGSGVRHDARGAREPAGRDAATPEGSSRVETIRIPVTGMTCAACQSRVQRTLQKQPGVSDATVNLMMKSATVTFDPAAVSPDRLVAAIRETGYGAELASPDRSAFAGAHSPLRSGQAPDGAVADPFMRWAMGALDPALRIAMPWLYAIPPQILSYTLLVMTLGVMAWAGRHFYTRAWAAFRHHSADMNTLVAVGTGAAFVYSVIATVAPDFFLMRGLAPDVYYEAVIIIIARILSGNAFEARAKRQTS